MAVPFSNTKLRVPKGFQNVLECLAREVLRTQPDNIHEFGAAYFENMLKVRSETGHDPAVHGAKLEDRNYNNESFKKRSVDPSDPQQNEAALKIQTQFRQHSAKEEVESMKEEVAATRIQAGFRGYLDREEVRKMKDGEEEVDIDLNDPEVEKAAIKIQAGFKGFKARKEVQGEGQEEEAEAEQDTAQEQGEAATEPATEQSEQQGEQAEEEEEEVDIDLEDPDVAKAAIKIQAGFKGLKARKELKEKTQQAEAPSEEAPQEPAQEAPQEPAQEATEEVDIDLEDPATEKAALKIQAGFRGYQTRNDLKDQPGEAAPAEQQPAASEEQAATEQDDQKEKTEEIDIDMNDPEVEKAATKIQAGFKGFKARKEIQEKTSSKEDGGGEEGEAQAAEQAAAEEPAAEQAAEETAAEQSRSQEGEGQAAEGEGQAADGESQESKDEGQAVEEPAAEQSEAQEGEAQAAEEPAAEQATDEPVPEQSQSQEGEGQTAGGEGQSTEAEAPAADEGQKQEEASEAAPEGESQAQDTAPEAAPEVEGEGQTQEADPQDEGEAQQSEGQMAEGEGQATEGEGQAAESEGKTEGAVGHPGSLVHDVISVPGLFFHVTLVKEADKSFGLIVEGKENEKDTDQLNYIRVAEMNEQGVAQSSGLVRIGDIITKVNDLVTAGMSIEDFIAEANKVTDGEGLELELFRVDPSGYDAAQSREQSTTHSAALKRHTSMRVTGPTAQKIVDVLSAFPSYKRPERLPDRLRMPVGIQEKLRAWHQNAQDNILEELHSTLGELTNNMKEMLDEAGLRNMWSEFEEDLDTDITSSDQAPREQSSVSESQGGLTAPIFRLDFGQCEDGDVDEDDEEQVENATGDGDADATNHIVESSSEMINIIFKFFAKELLYEPHKIATETYRAWLEENRESLSREMREARESQFKICEKVVQLYEEENDGDSAEEKRLRRGMICGLFNTMAMYGPQPDSVTEATRAKLAESPDIQAQLERLRETFAEVMNNVAQAVQENQDLPSARPDMPGCSIL